MAYNPYSNYTEQVMQFQQANPNQYNYSSGLVDPGMSQANASIAGAWRGEDMRRNAEWANKQRLYDPAFWQQAFGVSGGGGSGTIGDLTKIEQSPAYKWRYDQGLEALNRTAAAKRMLGSGNRLAELVKYGQGMASQEYENEFDRQYRLKALDQQRQLASQQTAMQGMSNMFRMLGS